MLLAHLYLGTRIVLERTHHGNCSQEGSPISMGRCCCPDVTVYQTSCWAHGGQLRRLLHLVTVHVRSVTHVMFVIALTIVSAEENILSIYLPTVNHLPPLLLRASGIYYIVIRPIHSLPMNQVTSSTSFKKAPNLHSTFGPFASPSDPHRAAHTKCQ